jgi:hypothetical protein
MKIKAFIVALVFCLASQSNILFAQDAVPEDEVSAPQNQESGEKEDLTFNLGEYLFGDPAEHHYFTGISGMFVANSIIFCWNKFVTKQGWTKVTLDDWKHFYEKDWEYDTDWYWTNFVLHPYQGSLYYMSGRNANFTPFESLLLSASGSLIWEYFCETNAPSINDFVYSSIGAAFMGEMLYNLSYEMQNLGYYASYVANPMRMWSDLVLWKKAPPRNSKLYGLDFCFGLGSATGGSFADGESQRETFPVSGGFACNIVYDNPYQVDSNTPFSQFELSMSGYFGKGSGEGSSDSERNFMYDVNISSDGFLFARTPEFLNTDDTETSLGAELLYDFRWHSFFEVSSLGLGAGIKQRKEFSKNNVFEWKEILGVNFLGTTDYAYYKRDLFPLPDTLYRSYSYTFGAENVFAFKWTLLEKNTISLQNRTYAHYAFPWQDQDFDTYKLGLEFQNILDLSYEYQLTDMVSIGLKDELYCKYAFYDDIPDYFGVLNSVGVFARMTVK